MYTRVGIYIKPLYKTMKGALKVETIYDRTRGVASPVPFSDLSATFRILPIFFCRILR